MSKQASSKNISSSNFQVIICTCPDQEVAETIAENIVAQRLAACVNILPKVRSIYHWEGNIESANESLLLIKTHADKFDSLQNTITNIHPYEVPEIISLDINKGLPSYLSWLSSSIFDKRS